MNLNFKHLQFIIYIGREIQGNINCRIQLKWSITSVICNKKGTAQA